MWLLVLLSQALQVTIARLVAYHVYCYVYCSTVASNLPSIHLKSTNFSNVLISKKMKDICSKTKHLCHCCVLKLHVPTQTKGSITYDAMCALKQKCTLTFQTAFIFLYDYVTYLNQSVGTMFKYMMTRFTMIYTSEFRNKNHKLMNILKCLIVEKERPYLCNGMLVTTNGINKCLDLCVIS